MKTDFSTRQKNRDLRHLILLIRHRTCVHIPIFHSMQEPAGDGINAMQPQYQPTEFFDGLSDDVKKCFEAYGAETYVDMLGTSEAPGPMVSDVFLFQ